MGYYKQLAIERRSGVPPAWLLATARDARRRQGSRGYWTVREAAVKGGLRPFDAMVAWQVAAGHDLEAARRIAAAIARRKGG